MARKTVNQDAATLEELPLFQEAEGGADDDTAVDAELTASSAEALDDLAAMAAANGSEEASDDDASPAPMPATIDPGAVNVEAAPASGGAMWIATGLFAIVAGAVLAGLGVGQVDMVLERLQGLERFGIAPMPLVLAGLLLAGFGLERRRHGSLHAQLLDAHRAAAHASLQMAALQESIAFLVEAQRFAADRPPASGEELDRVLMALQRHEEKINNLTKATKMYGKPLLEITSQLAETTQHVVDNGKGITALRLSADAGIGKIEDAVERAVKNAAPEDNVADQVSELLAEQRKSIHGELDAIAAVVTAAAAKLETAASQQTTPSAMAEMQQELGASLQGVQRELAGLATAVSQLRHAAREAPPPPSARPAPPPSVEPRAPAASEPAAASDGEPAAAPPAGLAQSISGSKRGAGKNVLGAIARLKNMRQ
jgi:hypothetical protein